MTDRPDMIGQGGGWRVRPTWDETWMAVATTIAKRSKCGKGIGAVVVNRQNRPVSTGYNGPPAGYEPARDAETCLVYCPRARARVMEEPRDPGYQDCPAVHAELNALLWADRTSVEGGTIYVTSAPCLGCAKAIANAGISRAVFARTAPKPHRDPVRSIELLKSSGVTVEEVEACNQENPGTSRRMASS